MRGRSRELGINDCDHSNETLRKKMARLRHDSLSVQHKARPARPVHTSLSMCVNQVNRAVFEAPVTDVCALLRLPAPAHYGSDESSVFSSNQSSVHLKTRAESTSARRPRSCAPVFPTPSEGHWTWLCEPSTSKRTTAEKARLTERTGHTLSDAAWRAG